MTDTLASALAAAAMRPGAHCGPKSKAIMGFSLKAPSADVVCIPHFAALRNTFDPESCGWHSKRAWTLQMGPEVVEKGRLPEVLIPNLYSQGCHARTAGAQVVSVDITLTIDHQPAVARSRLASRPGCVGIRPG